MLADNHEQHRSQSPNNMLAEHSRYYEQSFKNMLGHYQVTSRRLEKSLEKTRHEMVKLIRGVTNAEMLRRNNQEVSRESLTPDDGSPKSQTLLPPTGLVGMRIERGSAVSK